ILALALAGTTAFSVFGAALSANAATYDSTDKEYKVDAYMSYTPVASKIQTQKATTTDTTYVIDKNPAEPTVVDLDGKTVSEYIYEKYNIQEEYTAGTRYKLTST